MKPKAILASNKRGHANLNWGPPMITHIGLLFLSISIATCQAAPIDSNDASQPVMTNQVGNAAKAQFNLGVQYDTGEGVVQNDETAVEWYTKSALQGYAAAQYNLGVMYAKGKGVPQDDEKAAEWYAKSAAQGLALAQNNLANMYNRGQGVTLDYQKAIYWYTKAAEQGLAAAQRPLAEKYYHGKGGAKQNYEQAFLLYSSLAKKGYTSAKYMLGLMYEDGYGVTKDIKKAVYWYKHAARQGDSAAQYNLANMYLKGEDGVTQDHHLAYLWFALASADGTSSGAIERRDLAAAKLSSEELEKAKHEITVISNLVINDGGENDADFNSSIVRRFLTHDFGYHCNSFFGGFPDRYDNLDNPARSRDNWDKTFAIARDFSACVRAFSNGTPPHLVMTKMPEYLLLTDDEKPLLNKLDAVVVGTTIKRISQDQTTIEEELRLVKASQGRMGAAAEASRRAAKEDREWMQGIAQSLNDIAERMRPPPPPPPPPPQIYIEAETTKSGHGTQAVEVSSSSVHLNENLKSRSPDDTAKMNAEMAASNASVTARGGTFCEYSSTSHQPSAGVSK